jgi:hypothetical protein
MLCYHIRTFSALRTDLHWFELLLTLELTHDGRHSRTMQAMPSVGRPHVKFHLENPVSWMSWTQSLSFRERWCKASALACLYVLASQNFLGK